MTRTPARRAANAAPWSDLAVLGIDPSLTGTGIALVKGGMLQKAEVLTSDPTAPLPARLTAIRLGVVAFLLTYEPTVIAMEAVAFGMPQQASAMGAVQGVLQTAIWEDLRKRSTMGDRANGHFLSVNVNHVKKWVGARQKDEILLQVFKQYGLTFGNHNAADATVIAMIADAYLAYHSGVFLGWTKPQQEVLDKLSAGGFPWEAPPLTKKKTRRAREDG